jgi:predicted molibdopterin-dependent oxidoreductase YjgC
VSWYTAFDYVADKMKKIKDKYGAKAVMLSCRGGPWQDLWKSFIHAFGSPNFTNHDSGCGRNVHHASRSVYGLGRTGLIYDIKNAKHLVLFGRNILASLRIAEANQVMDMLEKGGRMTYVDVRQSMTGLKATRFFQVITGPAKPLLHFSGKSRHFSFQCLNGLHDLFTRTVYLLFYFFTYSHLLSPPFIYYKMISNNFPPLGIG